MANDYYKMMMDDFEHEPDIKIREKYIRAPFGWPGGKTDSLRYLLGAMPVRRIDNEVCGGTGVWSMNRTDKKTELKVFNDRHAGLTSFYRVVRDKVLLDALLARLELTVHSREEFIWCRDTWEHTVDEVERAARWYYMVKMSFSQLGRNFARSTNCRSQHAGVITRGLDLFPAVHTAMQRCQIENLDVIQALEDFDSEDTVHYVDPDYITAYSGIYKHTVDHKKLLACIFSRKGYVALSGYKNELYDSFKWDDRLTWKVPVTMTSQAYTVSNHLAHKKDQMPRGEAEEVLWIKY